MSQPSDDEIRVGVSACLLGEEVRWDATAKRNSFVVDVLSGHVRYVPVCPEMEMGLGVPREPIRLVRRGDEVRLVGGTSGQDHTETMRRFAEARVAALAPLDLDGFILKARSPSCGMERVPVRDHNDVPAKIGRGAFAAVLMDSLPLLPVEEEGRLNDPRLRENFVERLFAHRRLRRFIAAGYSVGGLVEFHSREKLLIMAHDPATYSALGRLVAGAKGRDPVELMTEYRAGFLKGLARLASLGRQTNVLQHVAGYFSERLGSDDRAEMTELIHSYREGLVPLVVPLTLVRHWVRHFGIEYLAQQTWLDPHPRELMLRNHA